MSKLAKFFIICAAVCVLGIVMSFAGYAAGGVDDLQKVADKHEWLIVGPNSTETDLLTVGEFQSIEAEGSLDITVIAPGEELDEEAVPNFVEDMYYQGTAGTVAVKWGKGNGAPVVTNENGVLKIKGSSEDFDTAQVNLTGEDPSPDVIVFCSDNELESIKALEKLTKMESLDVASNKIADITPLLNKTYLKKLDLTSNMVTEVATLSSCTALKELKMKNNQVTNFEPLKNLSLTVKEIDGQTSDNE